jgi:hypothetical protein
MCCMLVTQRKRAEDAFIVEESIGCVKQQKMEWIYNYSTRILGIYSLLYAEYSP